MQLTRLELKNIRSYSHAKIDFPTGIVMLSGDIGTGKSTILLAIEFALFGLLRGELSGNALLRNGTQQGSTELSFEINGNNYTIKRTLARTKKSVEQEAGYLLVNGIKQDATATELKSKILEILGYPAELLTKSKNMVYRYTVYTPQEEMKKILQEDKEERVAILRKVFGIDKYEKITKNAESYTKLLRERKRAYDALIIDIEEKKTRTQEIKKQQKEAQEKLLEIQPKLEKTRTNLTEIKQKITHAEQQKQQTELIIRELQNNKSQLSIHQQNQKQLNNEIIQITQLLSEAQKDIIIIDTNTIVQKIKQINQQILEKEKQTRTATIKTAEINAIKQKTTETTHKISLLDECPTCRQKVTPEHKHNILNKQQEDTAQLEQNLQEHTRLAKNAEEELILLKQELELARQQENESKISIIKKQRIQELEQRKKKNEDHNQILNANIQKINFRINELEKQYEPLKNIGESYTQIRTILDNSINEERTLSIQHTTYAQQEKHLSEMLKILEQELEKKEKTRKQLEKTQQLHHWLTDYFIPLMNTMEKQVMTKIHHEFDALFQQWFGMLVEDIMTAKLDETYTPIIQQNGYDTEVEYLSGGERTACALAYRLALNKTINSLISTIKTKDLLILDEPTDGFSTEQLDKMRDVLEQLQLKQVIIVSHEQKIESYADKVIRINKTEHTSQISI